MAKPIVAYFDADSKTAMKTLSSCVAKLGYSIRNTDIETGVLGFETGPSLRTSSGQIMSAQIFEVEPGKVQITIGGHRNQIGLYQVFDWSEARHIANTIIRDLSRVVALDTQRTGKLGPAELNGFQSLAAFIVGAFVIFLLVLASTGGHL